MDSKGNYEVKKWNDYELEHSSASINSAVTAKDLEHNSASIGSAVTAKEPDSIKDDKAAPVKRPAVGFRSLFNYPRGAYFCLGNEFSERFSFYGMKAVLVIYLITVHGLTKTNALLIYHTFVFAAYFSPIFGSILADGFVGRYRVILSVSIVYCVGHVLLTVGAIPSLGQAAMKALDYTGLFVIALATGGIKPCVSAFAADQFPPHMAAERTQFFSFFYFAINLGALMSQIITPVLRRQSCLGSQTCFPLAFGVPAIFMCLATFIFWCGTKFYKITRYRDNVIWRVCQCVCHALKRKCKGVENGEKIVKKTHWLDYAYPKFEQSFIDDVKTMFNVMVLYLPVVLFWALFEQQGSTWVLQANQMNGRMGRLTILPDQMGVINPFLVIILVPLMEGFFYPLLAKCNALTRPLRRMSWGGFLACAAFVAAGLLQLAVDKTVVPLLDSGHSRLTVVNMHSQCVYSVSELAGTKNATVDPRKVAYLDALANVTLQSSCPPLLGELQPVLLSTQQDTGNLITIFEPSDIVISHYGIKKTADGKTRLYIVFQSRSHGQENVSIIVEQDGVSKGEATYNSSMRDETVSVQQFSIDVEPDLLGSNEYEIFAKVCTDSDLCDKQKLTTFEAVTGAAHVLILDAANTTRLEQLIEPNSISILWQVPQYFIITVGELLLSVTGLAFSYSQASPKMKSVLQAIWLMTSAFGNLIDMGLSGSGIFEHKPALEFFVYAAAMGVIMIAFVLLAWRYKSSKREDE